MNAPFEPPLENAAALAARDADGEASRDAVLDAFGTAARRLGLSADDRAAWLSSTRALCDQQRGPFARLRELPTSSRLAIALFGVGFGGGSLGFFLLGGVGGEVALSSNLAVRLLGLGAVVFVLLRVAFRPLYRPPAPAWVLAAAWTLALGVPLWLCFFPAVGAAWPRWTPVSAALPSALACFAKGALMALPLALFVSVFHRGGRRVHTVALAVAAGTGGNLFLSTRCAGSDFTHALIGHSLIAASYGLLALVLAKVLERVPPRR